MKKRVKRLLSAVMTAALMISIAAASLPLAQAATFGPYTVGNMVWQVDVAADGSSGTLTVARRSGVSANTPIPNYSSSAKPPWYAHSAQVTNIVIGDGISEIGSWAFADFSRVVKVVMTASPARIGNDAFRACGALEHFKTAADVEKTFTGLTAIGDNAFYGCAKLDTLYIQDVTSIGANAFVGCSGLKYINAGDSGKIRSIGGQLGVVVEMNSDNTNPLRVIKSSVLLTGALPNPDIYTLPSGITSIDSEAFAYLINIHEVIIPASAATIRDRAFAYNPGLVSATFLGDAPATFGNNVFLGANDAFKILFFPHTQRWTTPRWQGYLTEVNNSRLTLDKYYIVLEKGASAELAATVYPNTARQAVRWETNSPGVASVSGKSNINDTVAIITGLNAGGSVVTAYALDSDAIAECFVIVLEKGATSTTVILDKALLTVGLDVDPAEYPTLTAVIQPTPDDAAALEQAARNLVWSSSDPTVAYVNPSALDTFTREIIPRKAGRTTITVATPDGTSRATCVVTVTAAPAFVPVTGVTIAATTVSIGAVIDLSAVVQPSNATNKDIEWSFVSSTVNADDSCISPDGVLSVPWGQTGNIVIEAAVKRGRADVDWGYSSDQDYIQQFTINVVTFLPVTGISGVPGQAYAGKPLQLTGTVSPAGAAYRTIEWSLGGTNTAAAYLDAETGILVPQTPGEISVTATVKNGVTDGFELIPYTQSFTIYVSPYVTNALTLRSDPGGSVNSAGSSQFASGETVRITATPGQGYAFAGWYSTNGGEFADAGSSTTQFTMPDNPTTVTAYFAYTGLPAGTVGGGGAGLVIPTPTHYFTYGTIYTRNSGVNFAHVTIRNLQLFSYATMDGRTLIRNQQYTTGSSGGYTEITLANGYLDTLAQGQHTLEVYFNDLVSVSAVFTVLATPQISQSYDDVYVSSWFYADVMYVSDQGWMTASPSEPRQFRPSSPVTQGEVIDALYRMAGNPTVMSQYGYALQGRDAAYAWVLANSVLPIGGVYNFDSAITRQDIAVILSRLISIMGMRYTYIRSAITFADEWQIDVSARTPVSNLYRAGIINGRSEGTFVPLGNMTRAEYAAVLHRFATALGNW